MYARCLRSLVRNTLVTDDAAQATHSLDYVALLRSYHTV